jgi:hypothetical protein
MLVGFPLGVAMVVGYWALRRWKPRSEWLRQVHPVMITAGPSTWGSPYNMVSLQHVVHYLSCILTRQSYFIGNVYVVLFSFQFIRKRYPAFWTKFNYIVAAAFPCGVGFTRPLIVHRSPVLMSRLPLLHSSSSLA